MDLFEQLALFPSLNKAARVHNREALYLGTVKISYLFNRLNLKWMLEKKVKPGKVKVGVRCPIGTMEYYLSFHEGLLRIRRAVYHGYDNLNQVLVTSNTQISLLKDGEWVDVSDDEFELNANNNVVFDPHKFMIRNSPSYRLEILSKIEERLISTFQELVPLSAHEEYQCLSDPFVLRSGEKFLTISKDRLGNESGYFKALLFGGIGRVFTETTLDPEDDLDLLFYLITRNANVHRWNISEILSMILKYRLSWYERVLI